MNFKKTFISALLLSTTLLAACGDDDNASPKEQFTFAEEKINLKSANLYLVDEDTYSDTHVYRDYFITDGVYNGGGGWDLDDFTGATYYIAVELAAPTDDEVGPGEYPLFWNWSNQEDENANIGYLYVEMGEDEEYVELDLDPSFEGEDNVVVSGGLDDGETMTLKFEGTLNYYRFDGTDWVTDEESSKLYFKGKVEDVRDMPARTAQSQLKKGFH